MKMETPPGRVRRLGLSLNHKKRGRFPQTKGIHQTRLILYLYIIL